jgi:UDP-3-O-[3-hydroxymyristoyl] glucosamine N-acyltransferase
VAIAGSVRIGNYVTIAGQTGIAGHLEIASQVTLLARSGVTKNITEPGAYTGFPARPMLDGRKAMVAQARLPELMERIQKLERRIATFESEATKSPA